MGSIIVINQEYIIFIILKNNIIGMCKYLFILIHSFFYTSALFGQVVWTGQISSDWNDPLNWSPAFVPDSATNVDIVLNIASPQPFWPHLQQETKANRIKINNAQFNFNNFPLSCNRFFSLNSTIETGSDSGRIHLFENFGNGLQVEQSTIKGDLSITTNDEQTVNLRKSEFDGLMIKANASRLRIDIEDSCYFNGNVVILKPSLPFLLGAGTIIVSKVEVRGDFNIIDPVCGLIRLGTQVNSLTEGGLKVSGMINIECSSPPGQTSTTSALSLHQVVNSNEGGKILYRGVKGVWIARSNLRVDSIAIFPQFGRVWLDSNVIYCPVSKIQSTENPSTLDPQSRLAGNTFFGNLFFTDILNEIQETRGFPRADSPFPTYLINGAPNRYYGDAYFKGKVNLGMFDTSSFHGNLMIEALDGSVYQRARFTGEQTTDINIGETSLQCAVIDKNSGANVNLITPINISNFLRFDNGIINAFGGNYIKFLPGASVYDYGTHGYVNGEVRKEGNTSFVFPTGSANSFKPLSITAPSNATDIVVVKYQNASPIIVGDTSQREDILHSIGNCEYWEVSEIAGNNSAIVSAAWDTPCLDNSVYFANVDDARIVRWDGAIWKNEGNGGYYDGLISTSDSTFLSGIYSFAAPRREVTTPPEPPHFPTMIIYPNPVMQNLNISLEQGFKQGMVIDETGRTISIHQLHTGLNSINVSYLPSGIYFLELIDARTQKVLKWVKM